MNKRYYYDLNYDSLNDVYIIWEVKIEEGKDMIQIPLAMFSSNATEDAIERLKCIP